jgi:competence protein ComEA
MVRASQNLAITAIGAALVSVVVGVVWFGVGAESTPAGAPVPTAAVALPSEQVLAVHVSGAVLSPGLVTVQGAARVADVVLAAGGARHDADLSAINLAQPVRDGDLIVVPSIGSSPAAPKADDGIDLNRATADQLEQLPGVGPVLAERIVAHREEYGAFVEVEDLLDVPGIGEAKLALLRASVASP